MPVGASMRRLTTPLMERCLGETPRRIMSTLENPPHRRKTLLHRGLQARRAPRPLLGAGSLTPRQYPKRLRQTLLLEALPRSRSLLLVLLPERRHLRRRRQCTQRPRLGYGRRCRGQTGAIHFALDPLPQGLRATPLLRRGRPRVLPSRLRLPLRKAPCRRGNAHSADERPISFLTRRCAALIAAF